MKNDRSVAAMVAKAINAYQSDDGFDTACMLADAMGGQRSEDGHEEGACFYFSEDGSALSIEEKGCVASVLSSGEANNFWYARMETRSFVFEAFGHFLNEAAENLRKALTEHGSQYGLHKEWFCKGFEFSVKKIGLNSSLRDGEQILNEDETFVHCARNGIFFPNGGVTYSNF